MVNRDAAAAATLILGLLTSPACAEMKTALLASWEGGPASGFAFASSTFSYDFSPPHGIYAKPEISLLYYDTHQNGDTIKVVSPGLSLGLGYRFTSDAFTLSIGPALQVLWEEKNPRHAPATSRTLLGVSWDGDATWHATPTTDVNVLASYDQTNKYFWSRAGALERLGMWDVRGGLGFYVGPEVTWQGDKFVHQTSGGAVVQIGADEVSTSFSLRAGYTRVDFSDGTGRSAPYFGASLYQALQ